MQVDCDAARLPLTLTAIQVTDGADQTTVQVPISLLNVFEEVENAVDSTQCAVLRDPATLWGVTGFAVGDLNGDDVPDAVTVLTVARTPCVCLSVAANDSGEHMRCRDIAWFGLQDSSFAPIHGVTINDFDGDGDLDLTGQICAVHSMSGFSYHSECKMSVLLNNGIGQFRERTVLAPELNGEANVWFDVDGDDLIDLVAPGEFGDWLRQSRDGSWAKFRDFLCLPGIQADECRSGKVNPGIAAFADLNGDGVLDAVVHRSLGNWEKIVSTLINR